jgi:two-component system, OmpR family, alkaline phosphatase synthesis response regulator PhoP
MPKILIVDDEPNMRVLLKATLEEFEDKGVELFTAQNGNEALEIINKEKPELVILDIMMPGMSGFEVCNTVKNMLGMKDIYILMLTAKVQDVDRQKGKDAGVDIYMTKPFNPDEVSEKVAKVLGIELQKTKANHKSDNCTNIKKI